MDYYVHFKFRSVPEEREISLEKFVLRWSICLAVVEPSEETPASDLDIQA
jgi:hypothetical protein